MRNMRVVASLPLGFHHGMLRRTRMACDDGFPLLYARRIARPLQHNELYRARILSTRVERCDDCTFGCCCAEHGYSSHSADKHSEMKGGVGIPLGHYPFPVGSEEAEKWPYPKN